MKIRHMVALAATLALGLTGAGAAAAFASDEPPVPSYVIVAWVMPSWSGSTTPTWPQVYFTSQTEATPDLAALDSQLTACGAQYQVDLYHDSDTTTALIAGKHLDGPNNPTEDLIGGGWGTAYKLIQNPPCLPEPKIDTTEWTDGLYGCGDTTQVQTRTVTTTTYSYGEGFEIVATVGAPVTETRTVALTAEQIAALDCPTPTPTASTPPMLAETGTDDLLPAGYAALWAAGAGIVLTILAMIGVARRDENDRRLQAAGFEPDRLGRAGRRSALRRLRAEK